MASLPVGLRIQGGGTLYRSTYVYEERTLVATYAGPNPEALVGATYEWKIGDRIVNTGTSNSYTPDDADIGKTITVTALIPAGNDAALRIAGVNAKIVAGINDQPTGVLFFQTEPLGADTKYTAVDAIQDEDGRGPMSYQWYVNDKPIAGATGSEFVLEQPFAGQPVKVTGTYTDASGRVTTVPSGTLPVALDVPGTVSVEGEIAPNAVLRAKVADPNGVETIHYAWDVMDRNGFWTTVSDATGPTFAIGASAPAAVRLVVDYADGSAGPNFGIANVVTVLGTNGSDNITTEGSDERVFAGGGNDIVRYIGGSRVRVDGGAGLDVLLTDSGARVLRSNTTPGQWTVEDTFTTVQADLVNVERVHMNGKSVALDIDGAAGQAMRLYDAAFDRSPDPAGIGFWISRLDNGVSLKAVANAFVASPEFQAEYGAARTNAELVAMFYQTILDRAPDAAGAAHWQQALDSGAASRADVLLAFSESAEHVAMLVGQVGAGIAFLPYGGA